MYLNPFDVREHATAKLTEFSLSCCIPDVSVCASPVLAFEFQFSSLQCCFSQILCLLYILLKLVISTQKWLILFAVVMMTMQRGRETKKMKKLPQILTHQVCNENVFHIYFFYQNCHNNNNKSGKYSSLNGTKIKLNFNIYTIISFLAAAGGEATRLTEVVCIFMSVHFEKLGGGGGFMPLFLA